VTLSLRRCQTALTGHAYGLEKRGPYPATRLDQMRHSMGLATGVVNVAGCNIDLALKRGTAVAEEWHGFQERVGLGMTGRGVKKDPRG
jgi:hypothetical protein